MVDHQVHTYTPVPVIGIKEPQTDQLTARANQIIADAGLRVGYRNECLEYSGFLLNAWMSQ